MTRLYSASLFRALCLSLAVMILCVAGCTKREESKSAEENALLSTLPTTAVGFYTFRTDIAGYQKLRAQNWSSWSESALKDLDQHLTALDPGDGQAISGLISVIKESGLITESPEKPDGIKEGLLFVAAGSNPQDMAAGLYLNSIPSVNCIELIQKMVPHLEKTKMKVSKEQSGDTLSLTISGTDPDGTTHTVYLGAQKNRMALSSQKTLTDRFFSAQVDDGFKIISATPVYKQAIAEVSSGGEQFGFGYIDLARVKQIADSFPGLPNREVVKDIPFNAAAISQAILNGVATSFAVSMTPSNDQQKLLISNLERMPENSLAERAPQDAVMYFGIDGQLIKTLEEGAISELSSEQKEYAKQWISSIQALNGISITFKNSAGDAPFPDLIISAQSSQAPALHTLIKNELSGLLTSQFQMSRWLNKDIQGVPVTYMLTPLGVGIYLGTSKDIIIATSTESAMSSAILALNDPKKSLTTNISDDTRSALTASNSLFNSYADFAKLATLIESVQGSMSLFTGGANPVNASQVQGLRRMGTGAMSLRISKGFLKGQIHVTPQENGTSH